MLVALAGGRKISLKGIIAGLLLTALTAAPALADEYGEDGGLNATQVGSSAAASQAEGREAVICPNCGRTVITGGHGQAVRSTVCPYCGKDMREEEEAEKVLCVGADAGFFSRYVSRGVTLSSDPVFQPGAWASYRGVNLSVWGNMDLTDINGNVGEFNELDFALGYSGKWDTVNYSAGGIYYVFPNTGSDDTAELYASLGYDTILQPTLTAYYDFMEADGLYLVLGISHAFEIPVPSDKVTACLELSAQAGWGTKQFNEFNSGSYHDAFTDAVFTVCLPVGLYESFSITPSVSYSTALDRTIRTKNSDNDNVVFGLVISAGM